MQNKKASDAGIGIDKAVSRFLQADRTLSVRAIMDGERRIFEQNNETIAWNENRRAKMESMSFCIKKFMDAEKEQWLSCVIGILSCHRPF